MISKKIEHPLRTIEITYDEQKPFRPLEEAMLERYTRLHNFVKELYEEYTDVQTRYEMHDKNISNVVTRFKAIKMRMMGLEKSAKQVLNMMIPEKAVIEQIVLEGQEFKKLMQEFHKDVQMLANESDAMFRVFIPLDCKDERMTEIFDEYQQFRTEIAEGGTGYSIDIAKHNNDEKQFMGSMNDMGQKQEKFIGTCNKVIDRYNMLIEEVEKTYAQFEKYDDMIEMMRLMVVTPVDITRFCLN